MAIISVKTVDFIVLICYNIIRDEEKDRWVGYDDGVGLLRH